jgi:hypothetical protein
MNTTSTTLVVVKQFVCNIYIIITNCDWRYLLSLEYIMKNKQYPEDENI